MSAILKYYVVAPGTAFTCFVRPLHEYLDTHDLGSKQAHTSLYIQ